MAPKAWSKWWHDDPARQAGCSATLLVMSSDAAKETY
jgi:hypothetical protein